MVTKDIERQMFEGLIKKTWIPQIAKLTGLSTKDIIKAFSSTGFYNTEGLVSMWDGEMNTHSGHDASATTWNDLILSSGNDMTLNTSVISKDKSYLREAIYTGSFNAIAKGNKAIDGIKTIEVVFKELDSNVNTYCSLVELGGNFRAMVFDKERQAFFTPNKAGYAINYTRTIDANIHAMSGTAPSYDEACSGFVYDAVQITTKGNNGIGGPPSVISIGGGLIRYDFAGEIFCVRLYDRELTADEMIANQTIDLARFSNM